MPITIYNKADARAKLLAGAKIIYDVVSSTAGPGGRPTLQYDGVLRSTKDGCYSAGWCGSNDRAELAGIVALRQVGQACAQEAGDGTTAAITLAYHLLKGGEQALSSTNPAQLVREMEAAVEEICRALDEMAIPVQGEMIRSVCYCSTNRDERTTNLIVDAFRAAGPNGLKTVAVSDTEEDSLETGSGMMLPNGWFTSFFINTNKGTCVLESPRVLITDRKLAQITPEWMALLERAFQGGKPLWIVADDFSGHFLQVLTLNKQKNGFPVLLTKAPGVGLQKKDWLHDLWAYCGGVPIWGELGQENPVENHRLGEVRRVIANRTTTTVEGIPSAAVDMRMAEIRQEMQVSGDPFTRDKCQERIARLSGKIVTLKVGGSTELARKERMDRIEDAINAVQKAIDGGVVPGGGVAMWQCCDPILKTTGQVIVMNAVIEPFRSIMANAGMSLNERVIQSWECFDVTSDKVVDAVEAGILDPVTVVKTSLRKAASVAAQILSAGALIIEEVTTK
jgi:chaperonin GroEL